ncbi:hypothetical protein V8E54_009926 [Elaphomyces granulatus]
MFNLLSCIFVPRDLSTPEDTIKYLFHLIRSDSYRPALPLNAFPICVLISVYVIAGVLLLVCYVVLAAQKYFQAPTMPRRKKATAKHVLPSSPLPARQQTPDATTKRSAAPSSHVSLSSRVTTPPPSTHTAFPSSPPWPSMPDDSSPRTVPRPEGQRS